MAIAVDPSQESESNKRADVLRDCLAHAAFLNEAGVGPSSRMCFDLLREKEAANPDLLKLYAIEGRNFRSLAQQIAPVELATEYIENMYVEYPLPVTLDPKKVMAHLYFLRVLANTPEARDCHKGKIPSRVTPKAVESYIRFSAEEPNLMIACAHIGIAMETFVCQMANLVDNVDHTDLMLGFGRQFRTSSLTKAFPFEIYMSLVSRYGDTAAANQLDQEVMIDCLTTMRASGKFRLPRASGASEAYLHCPMELYLFELLGAQDVLSTIMRACDRATKDLGKVSRAVSPLQAGMLKCHSVNLRCVQAGARFIRDLNVIQANGEES